MVGLATGKGICGKQDPMTDFSSDSVRRYFRRSLETMRLAASEPTISAAAIKISGFIHAALLSGRKLLIAGNGGSAADAQHIAGEFVSRFAFDRPALPSIALTTDTSVLTAIGNDYGFEHVFERQVRGLGQPGDVFLAISTSGQSKNIIVALRAAREMGLVTAGFTGRSGGPMSDLCDVCLFAPSNETPQIQQIHIVAAHAICELVEVLMFPMEDAARRLTQGKKGGEFGSSSAQE